MKIIEIIPQLSSGGAERFTVDLCNKLAEDNEVTLVVFHSITKAGFYENELSDRVKLISLHKKKGIDILLIFKINRIINKIKPDIIHTHLRAIIYIIIASLLIYKPKYFHTIHNSAEKEAGDRFNKLIRYYLFKWKKILPVTISKESNRSFIDFYGLSATVINNGRNIPSEIEVSKTTIKEFEKYRIGNRRVLVNLARIDIVKRQTMLARVATRLTNEGFNFSLLIIGSKKNSTLVDEIESNSCSNIHILGEKHNPLEYLKMSDAFCLSSSYEGLPISLIESIGIGIVPICTPVGGIIDVIENNVNGLLSSDLSEIGFYNILKHFLLMDNSALVKMKNASKKSYEPYSMNECANKYINLFNK